MMSGSGHLISSAGIATGMLVLTAFVAWAGMALLSVLALRRAGEIGLKRALWGGGVVLGGSLLLISLLFERGPTRDLGAERRAIEARASELTAHAIAPGSALTCLDAIANILVESACEKAVRNTRSCRGRGGLRRGPVFIARSERGLSRAGTELSVDGRTAAARH